MTAPDVSAAVPTDPGAPRWRVWAPPGLLCAAAALLALLVPLVSGAFWPIAAAQAMPHWWMVRSHTDPISPLPIRGGTWVLQPWIFAQVLRGIWATLGAGGLSALAALLAACIAWLAYLAARTTARPWPALIGACATVVLMFPPTLESQLAGTACFALLVLVLRRGYVPWISHERGAQRVLAWCAAPLTVVLWTNVHGSAVVGVGLCLLTACGCYGTVGVRPVARKGGHLVAHTVDGARDPSRAPHIVRRTAWVIVCAACVFASPLGWHLIPYVHNVETVRHLRALTPIWRRLTLTQWRTWGVVVGLVFGAFGLRSRVYARANRRGVHHYPPQTGGNDAPLGQAFALRRFVALCLFALFAFNAERNVVWFAVLAGPEVAATIDAWWKRGRAELRSWIIAATIWAAAIGLIAVFVPGAPIQHRFALATMPDSRLMSGIDRFDNVLVSLEWADYVRLETGASVWGDARLERYEPSDIDRYVSMQQGKAAAYQQAIGVLQKHTHVWTYMIVRHNSAPRWFDAAAELVPSDHVSGTGAARGVRVGFKYVYMAALAGTPDPDDSNHH